MKNSFDSKNKFDVGNNQYEIFSLARLDNQASVDTLPFSLKILLENLLRHEDGENVTRADIEALIS